MLASDDDPSPLSFVVEGEIGPRSSENGDNLSGGLRGDGFSGGNSIADEKKREKKRATMGVNDHRPNST